MATSHDVGYQESRAAMLSRYPIGNGLDGFRAFYHTSIASSSDSLSSLSGQDLEFATGMLLIALRKLPAASHLASSNGEFVLPGLFRLASAVSNDTFDLRRMHPLLEAALARGTPDAQIWDLVNAALEHTHPQTPPSKTTVLRIQASSLQTPFQDNSSSIVNSSERRCDMDKALKAELTQWNVDVPGLYDAFFGGVEGLAEAADSVLQKCTTGEQPLFANGWRGWPHDANQDGVLLWFEELLPKLEVMANHANLPPPRRRLFASPNQAIRGSCSERKLDIGFMSNHESYSIPHWSHIHIPGELKSNRSADTRAQAWLDIARYAREALSAQDTRRFVLAFTLCGSLMRIWIFDRLGASASEQYDIIADPRRFVSTMLAFPRLSDKDIGFDPTVITEGTQRYMVIERNNRMERIFIRQAIRRERCIVGRATTCWRAYSELDPTTPLVVKDSWQHTERPQEGEMAREATEKGAVHVAAYYFHTTVRVDGTDDDVSTNVRRGLVSNESRHKSRLSTAGASQSRSGSSRGKRVSESNLSERPTKRPCISLPTGSGNAAVANREHRRLILSDCGKPIYKASSRRALLMAIERCIAGHESLLDAGILHRDISLNNLMISDDETDAFLIDLDLAIRIPRKGPSGAQGRTGTRAFMAIGALEGYEHSFMHDLESFFWVLFWICIHYNGPGEATPPTMFDDWNYQRYWVLAAMKRGIVGHADSFSERMAQSFTSYYKPLMPLLSHLRDILFSNGLEWRTENRDLYAKMTGALADAQNDEAMNGYDRV